VLVFGGTNDTLDHSLVSSLQRLTGMPTLLNKLVDLILCSDLLIMLNILFSKVEIEELVQ